MIACTKGDRGELKDSMMSTFTHIQQKNLAVCHWSHMSWQSVPPLTHGTWPAHIRPKSHLGSRLVIVLQMLDTMWSAINRSSVLQINACIHLKQRWHRNLSWSTKTKVRILGGLIIFYSKKISNHPPNLGQVAKLLMRGDISRKRFTLVSSTVVTLLLTLL